VTSEASHAVFPSQFDSTPTALECGQRRHRILKRRSVGVLAALVEVDNGGASVTPPRS